MHAHGGGGRGGGGMGLMKGEGVVAPPHSQRAGKKSSYFSPRFSTDFLHFS